METDLARSGINADSTEEDADYIQEKENPIQVKEYTISGYGADFDVEGLVRRLNRGDIEIPEFQRAFVWSQPKASRFIESLLMGLPVPGVFLYRDRGSQTLRVIDGQQRLQSLRFYFDGRFPETDRVFALSGLESRFDGRAYVDLLASDQRKLNDSIIHASIIEQLAPDDKGTSQFSIFERLNTTASPLSPQEIRAAIYGGTLNDLLAELNKCADWRKLVGKPNRRKRDQELVLRFLALYYTVDKYKRTMKEFLNKYMRYNRDLEKHSKNEIRELFESTTSTILRKLGERAFRPERTVNAAVLDALMVGVARRLETGPIHEDIRQQYEDLLNDERFKAAVFAGTSQPHNVRARLELATDAFKTAV